MGIESRQLGVFHAKDGIGGGGSVVRTYRGPDDKWRVYCSAAGRPTKGGNGMRKRCVGLCWGEGCLLHLSSSF